MPEDTLAVIKTPSKWAEPAGMFSCRVEELVTVIDTGHAVRVKSGQQLRQLRN